MNIKTTIALLIGGGLVFSALVVVGWRGDPELELGPEAAAEIGGCPLGAGECQGGRGHEVAGTVAPPVPELSDAPDFSLERLGGGTITLAEFRGQKPVIVDFWASWCPNCRRDMPKLNSWYKKYQDRVEVIGVNLQESHRVVEKYVQDADIAFPIALDPRSEAATKFGIQFTNTHVLIDKQGNLLRIIPGDIKETDIVSLLEL